MAYRGNKALRIAPTPKEDEVPLVDILEKLEHSRGISFAFQKQFLDGKFSKPFPLLNDDVETYLSELLTPLQLGFRQVHNITEKIYIIYPLPTRIKSRAHILLPDSAQTLETKDDDLRVISGRVEDVRNVGMSGVNVVLKGNTLGAITDGEGNFSMVVPRHASGTLVVSHLGFRTQEVALAGSGAVAVMLEENPHALPEVIVTALGINRDQKALGYAATTVGATTVSEAGYTNFASALYGKVPGVRIRTAPGGATSAVTMQIRGFNSLNYNTQPLYVIDGVLMRDSNEKGAAGLNNDDYFTDQRVRGNGILDISPGDIETLTVLKGASATALYGSDAASGVVLITTKKGSKKAGLGVNVNYSASVEEAAFMPKYQNVYGPGYDRATNVALGADKDGWVMLDTDGDGQDDARRPLFESYAQFGPAMQGQETLWWDGSKKPYVPQPNNYKDFYRQGISSVFNVAFNNQIERLTYRFSYTRNDYQGIQVGGKLARNTFNLNTSLKLSSKLTADLVVNFTNSRIHNRPMKVSRLLSSYSGFFNRAQNMSDFFAKYQTSEGYKWVPYSQSQRNPEEAVKFTTPRGYEVMDLLWQQLKNSENELQNRIITSFTLKYDLHKNFQFRGRLGNDLTRTETETKQHNEYPTSFNGASSTGSYGIAQGRYSFFYTDALLTYDKKLGKDFRLTVNGGVQLRNEFYNEESNSTNGGLVVENWFDLRNSFHATLNTKRSQAKILKYAYLGLVDLSYKDMLFLEGTWRQEYSSTLPPSNNSYFYPSVNSSFVFTEAFAFPAFVNFGKIRASYGIVGNAPPVYEANVLYEITNLQTVNGPVIAAGANGSLYGNNNIRPERKHELEVGVETRLFKNTLGIDLTYYESRTAGQILKLDLPSTTGSTRILTNIGELRSHGWELGLSVTPLTRKILWTTTVNAAVNTTTLNNLVQGIDQLIFRDFEGSSVRLVAEPNQPIGNIYVHPRLTDSNGNFVINDDGLYVMDKSRYTKAGNILPRVTGGVTNQWLYKNFSLEAQIDYSFGGQIISPPLKYGKAAGQYETTLQYRDAEHGGLSYYVNDQGENVMLNGSTAPTGSTVYHDGILLEGVRADGQPNSKVIDAASYYLNMYDWGNNAWNEDGMIYKNSYVKMREIVFSYSLPRKVTTKMHFQTVRLSLIGRNLFYLWRTLENLDPESSLGTNWQNQSVDEGAGAATRSYGFSVHLGF